MTSNKIYVATNYKKDVLSVVIAKNKELANAFWQGQGHIPHLVEEIDPDEVLYEQHTGIRELIRINARTNGMGGDREVISVKKP